MTIAKTMINGQFIPHSLITPEYLYLHSETYGDPDRIVEIKKKPETVIIAGNMFYINYWGENNEEIM